MPTNQHKNQHLLWRAGFGPASDGLDQLHRLRQEELYAALKQASAGPPSSIDVVDDSLRGLALGIGEARRQADEASLRQLREKSRQAVRSLNGAWLEQLSASPQQLREKMAFFWHGHFATRNLNVFYQQQLLSILRQHALGSFRTLLHEVSQSAAMLNFLNAQQNRKDHPNENFAREVMELFTLGRGNYTENDVKEAARAFTGWGANLKGDFQFRRLVHDAGTKTVLGQTGNFDGTRMLDLLLEQKQTARFITQKIYRFFVHETTNKSRIEQLADSFFKSDYNIGLLLDRIFTADWFYESGHIGTRIKSPVELIAGLQRLLPLKLEDGRALLLLQRALGQVLFYPPSVAGWPGGRNWIDSSTLMLRMRMPLLLLDRDELNVRPKDDDDTNGGREEKGLRSRQPLRAQIDWQAYLKNYENVPRAELFERIAGRLLQTSLRVPAETVSAFADSSSREEYIKTATLQLMSTPEYQLC